MRLATPLLALLLVVGAAAPETLAAAPAAPKVVVVVGPVGELTGRYLARGEAAAREAERFTPNVVRVFTPNATWPAVKRALQGASMVVYLGHGNGWPSRYRAQLYPPTQNGFGLNPVAGGGNDAHQYFGEGRIAADVKLAKDAVVLLHNLCYASGNTEPGLPEGTIDEARQRVDNYAAGFIRAGASAVVAEGHMSPAWYVRQILSSNKTVERIWGSAPTNHGNTFTFASVRSPGFTAAMDPVQPGAGFYRSLVVRSGVRSSDMAAGATVAAPDVVEAEPTLVGTGLELSPPYFKGRPIAGAEVELWIPYAAPANRALASTLTVGVRWDPIDVAAASAPPDAEADPDGASDTVDRITLLQPERLGSVVDPVAVTTGSTRIRVPVRVPEAPGRYRLVLTFHDASGVAYDAASQALIPGLLARVTGELAAAWLVEPALTVTAGAPVVLPATVANVGALDWGTDGTGVRLGRSNEAPSRPLIVGHWVRLDPTLDNPVVVPDLRLRLEGSLAGGATAAVELAGAAPAAPGQYLLVLDVVVPGRGSLVAAGGDPAMVRVTVE
jgi:hypothetical protein